MAKLIKYFGIGSKKNAPPKDYSNHKSNSVQDLSITDKFFTTGRNHQCRSVLSSSNFATFDTRSSSHSSRHHRCSQPNVTSHSKYKSSSSNPASGESSPSKENHNSLSSPSAEGNCIGANHLQKHSPENPPKLRDEYSDPFDLKKQIAENPDLLGTSATAEDDLPSVSDDDYSVPFEIKNMRDKKLKENREKQSKQNAARYENSQFEETGAVGGSTNGSSNHQKKGEKSELRPQGEYDDPWEWSTTHSIIFKEGIEDQSVPAGCVKVLPDESRTDVAIDYSTTGRDGTISTHDYENSTEKRGDRHDYVNAHILPPSSSSVVIEETEAGSSVSHGCAPTDVYGIVNKVDKRNSTVINPIDAALEREASAQGARPKDSTPTHIVPVSNTAPLHRRPGNYEEPWDLSLTQHHLEECFKAKITTSDDAPCDEGTNNMAEKIIVKVPPDTRPQEGYEKPWDWKPDKKDDRLQEGYEKPWDWKPHQKDDRPMEEYDQPWDKKQAQLQQDIMKAKSAKEIQGCANNRGSEQPPMNSRPPQYQPQPPPTQQQAVPPPPQDARPKIDSSKHTSPQMAEDSRPMEEYDVPWDRKKKPPVSRSVSESSQASPLLQNAQHHHQQQQQQQQLLQQHQQQQQFQHPQHLHQSAVLASPQHVQQRASPSHRSSQPSPVSYRSSTSSSSSQQWLVGERIDPKQPLEKQGWYHGAIGRVDAERFLRVHKEGSYLVRMSESNKNDFSLSLKSARGFMHMKIVSKNGRFILGQFSQPFTSIPLMIHHYSVNKLPIKGAEHMSLLHPVREELL